MILQKVVFPMNHQADVNSLYYRTNTDITILTRESVHLSLHTKLNLCTFFNAFSATKWCEYTIVKEVKLHALISGSGKVRLMQRTEERTWCIWEQELSDALNEQVTFTFGLVEGFYYIELETFAGEMDLHEADFSTELPEMQQIKLVVSMCTFKREAYVRENISQISKYILENENSALKEKLGIFIVDNGKTLSKAEFPISQISLIPNENTGGSGGFTRGLIEVLYAKTNKQYTHVILMDDDIKLDTETLERTYAFLRYLKQEFQNSVLGGAMLHNEMPCFLQPIWNNWRGEFAESQSKLNLGDIVNLEKFDVMQGVDYQPWWYCCLPLSTIGPDNLPLPFFIHGDDVEYGLRNGGEIIQLNGICVWHDSFENKRPSHLEYYDTRNYLIINSIYNNEHFSLLRQMLNCFKRSTALIFRMRYKDVQLITLGINDFLKGPEWWGEQNISVLHQQIIASGYQYEELPKDCGDSKKITEISKKRLDVLKYIVTLNGAILPKRKEVACVLSGDSPFLLYRRKQAYLLDAEKKKAVCVEFSLKKLVKAYALLAGAFVRLVVRYRYVKNEYKKCYRQLGTENYWKQHFEK